MIDTSWIDQRINRTISRGKELLGTGYTAKTHLHVYQVDEDPAPDGIPVIRLKNGDYMFAPAEWAIPDEVLERYKTKPLGNDDY